MATLEQNINQIIYDFAEIKSAITKRGVPIVDGTPTSYYASKVDELYDKATTDAKAEFAEVYSAIEEINQDLTDILSGVDTGGKGYYDEFWDVFQANGTRSNYNFGFGGVGWTDQTFKPIYNLRPIYACIGMFYYCAVTDLEARLQELGITLDLSGNANYSTLFFGASCTVIPEVKFSGLATTLSEAFAYCRALHTIRKIVLSDGFNINMNTAFTGCYALENIEFEGIIPANISFRDSTKLSKASITNIIEHLSATASEPTLTLSKVAVDKAFESSLGANDGSTANENKGTVEWQTLRATRFNWKYVLV